MTIQEFRDYFNYVVKLDILHGKRVECTTFWGSSQRTEYDSNSCVGICCSVVVLRQSLMAERTSSIISDASWCSSM